VALKSINKLMKAKSVAIIVKSMKRAEIQGLENKENENNEYSIRGVRKYQLLENLG
jgi:hypothetical protein